MRARFLAFSLGIACTGAIAADAPQPQPLATGGAIATAKASGRPVMPAVASPVMMQTSVVRSADGTLAVVCEQKPNAHPAPIRVNRPAPEPQQ